MAALSVAVCNSNAEDRVAEAVAHAAHFLPAQGPIREFIHHNTLHAFEDHLFEEAVVEAGRLYGCEPFLSAEHYRREILDGRITERDVETVLAAELGARGAERPVGDLTRLELWRRIVIFGLPDASGEALAWVLAESEVLDRFRRDVPPAAKDSWAVLREDDERKLVRALWEASLAAVGRTNGVRRRVAPAAPRLRDQVLARAGIDTDHWIHPPLIRFVSAYLDQGLAHVPMEQREESMYRCFLDCYGSRLSRWCGAWAGDLPAIVMEDRRAQRSPLTSIHHSLTSFGVREEEWPDFLTATALSLRGWAGMVRQMEMRPDRVPTYAVPAALSDFFAVQLLLERAAIGYAARIHLGFHGNLGELRASLQSQPRERAFTDEERAWPIFQVAQLCGWTAPRIAEFEGPHVETLERELALCDDLHCRLFLHLAYERHLRKRFYDALVQHPSYQASAPPAWQAVFCLDEREESFRRHLEEVDPTVETLGMAGFFGVAMYYRGARDAHPRALCPVAIQPEHFVRERPQGSARDRGRDWRRRAEAAWGKTVHFGSRTLMGGALLAVVLGVIAIVPLVLRVVFPRLAGRLLRTHPPDQIDGSSLLVEREAATPPMGRFTGFTVPEMADLVRELLETVGIMDRMSRLIVVVGHGSVSLNNPHESAHNCGACGGGHGGPNARAIAEMANDVRVRTSLASDGVSIPATTWFVGAERDTCSNQVTFFDLEHIPSSHAAEFVDVRRSFDSARAHEAHERCRRFELVSRSFSAMAALLHVESRSVDLAQPRPEYGHSTNAFCVVGRRSRTRGLFLDRRCFLASYDHTRDPDGHVLARLLSAVVPVVCGINLEYFFSRTDPQGYGCGTKLPHNVASLLGVMDGAQSDLRTGLPWQMVETHEPVRLSLVVECDRVRLERVIADNQALRRWVENQWLFLACLEPYTNTLWKRRGSDWVRHVPERVLDRVEGTSAAWYRDRRGNVPPARIKSAGATRS